MLASGPARSCAEAVPGTSGWGCVGNSGFMLENSSPIFSSRSADMPARQAGEQLTLLLLDVVCDGLLELAHLRVTTCVAGRHLVDLRQQSLDLLVLVDGVGGLVVAVTRGLAHRRVHQDLLGCRVRREREADLLDELILLVAVRRRGVAGEQPLHLAMVVLDDGGHVSHASPVPTATFRPTSTRTSGKHPDGCVSLHGC